MDQNAPGRIMEPSLYIKVAIEAAKVLAHLLPMRFRAPPPMLDLLSDGRVRPRPSLPLATRVLVAAVVVAVVCVALAVAVLALWLLAVLVPVAVVAVAVAWVALRVRRWQGRSRPSTPIVVRWPPR